ncbi:MAG: hypothetical protein CMA36_04195 [Euryarchaeota archaeon]|nr:hypothetical protein [Euryarchaeota archaeon]
MQGHQWGHQSRSRRESNLVRDAPGEDILVGISEKGGAVGAADGATGTTRAEVTAAGVLEAKADGATGTTRAEVTAAGVRTTPVVKRAIQVEEGIRARAEEETRGDDPTRAFFIRIILRILWRRVLR